MSNVTGDDLAFGVLKIAGSDDEVVAEYPFAMLAFVPRQYVPSVLFQSNL